MAEIKNLSKAVVRSTVQTQTTAGVQGSVPECKTDSAWRAGNKSLIPPTFDFPWPLLFNQLAILFF